MDLNEDEIRRILSWASGADGESYLDEADWPLVVKLATAVGEDPVRIAPDAASLL